MQHTPLASGFSQPAEWHPHRGVWLAWPCHENLWQETLPEAQAEFRALCQAIADVDPKTGEARGELLEILVPSSQHRKRAQMALAQLPVRIHLIPFGDIWLRDTAPLFLTSKEGMRACVRFGFNGWGGKYVLPHDAEVSAEIARHADVPCFEVPLVLEGGSIEIDGEGTCLTTEQCLLNPNRNPGLQREQIETHLRESLGVEKILWLKDGLLNDHTDGHIDTIARFVAPGVVVCMQAQNSDDPNREVLEQIAHDLEQMTDAKGRRLQVVRIPSPGLVQDEDGEVMPASYVNFYIGNTTVVVPTYGTPYDDAAVEALGACFPNHRTVGLSAKAILSGGGAFHCISQQEPQG